MFGHVASALQTILFDPDRQLHESEPIPVLDYSGDLSDTQQISARRVVDLYQAAEVQQSVVVADRLD